MSDKINLQQLNDRVFIGRNLAVIFHIFALILIVTLLFLPNALSLRVKVWSVTSSGVSFVAVLVGLLVVRNDPTSILYFTFVSFLTSGIFMGFAIFQFDKLL